VSKNPQTVKTQVLIAQEKGSPQQRDLAIADFRQLTEGLEKSLLRKAF